jgi:hypothetical protein
MRDDVIYYGIGNPFICTILVNRYGLNFTASDYALSVFDNTKLLVNGRLLL